MSRNKTLAVKAQSIARGVPFALGLGFLSIPLFPALVTLTAAAVPGVSLLPRLLTLGLLALACAIALYGLVAVTTTRGEPVPTLVPLATFPAAAALAALLGLNPAAGALFTAILVFGLIWHVWIVRFFRAPRVAPVIFACFLLSGALAAALAIAMLLTKTPAGVYTVGHGRAIGTFIVPGELAGYLIVYVPFAYALAVEARRGLRALAWVGLGLGAAAFALTFSRAGIAGMAAAIAVFLLLQYGRRGAGYAIAIVAVALASIGFIFNAHHDPSENFARLSIWQAALATFERFPLTGVGPFEFTTAYHALRLPDGEPRAFHAHSILLTVAAETGLVGVAALLFGWWRFVAVFRERLRRAPERSTVALAIAAGLAGTWVQGLVDTVSVVIFALWYPFMALALATLAPERAVASDAAVAAADAMRYPTAPHAQAPRYRVAIGVALAVVATACAFVQVGSDAAFARIASPHSFAAHLPPDLGARVYGAIERVAPLPFVEATLGDDALRRGDLDGAAQHSGRMPPGTLRDELNARIALTRGRTDDAVRLFLDAGDDDALQAAVARLAASGRERDAYALEETVLRRLAASRTRPNAVADSWWRLGRLAVRLHAGAEAEQDYARASALAPFNTKYLIDAGTLALQERRADAARTAFARANEIDPGSADAVAGLGLAALERGDDADAKRLAARAAGLNPRAALTVRLQHRLATSGA